jgi:hypothetical protein
MPSGSKAPAVREAISGRTFYGFKPSTTSVGGADVVRSSSVWEICRFFGIAGTLAIPYISPSCHGLRIRVAGPFP